MKMWHEESKHEDAYLQLVNYLKLRNRDAGYLITFSLIEGKSKCEWINYDNKRIYDVVIQADVESLRLKELKSLIIKAEEVQRELNDVIDSAKNSLANNDQFESILRSCDFVKGMIPG